MHVRGNYIANVRAFLSLAGPPRGMKEQRGQDGRRTSQNEKERGGSEGDAEGAGRNDYARKSYSRVLGTSFEEILSAFVKASILRLLRPLMLVSFFFSLPFCVSPNINNTRFYFGPPVSFSASTSGEGNCLCVIRASHFNSSLERVKNIPKIVRLWSIRRKVEKEWCVRSGDVDLRKSNFMMLYGISLSILTLSYDCCLRSVLKYSISFTGLFSQVCKNILEITSLFSNEW